MTTPELRDLLGRCTPEKILALTGPIWSINRIDEDDSAIFWEVVNYDGFLIQFHERDDKRAKNYAEMVYALPALAAELIEARAEIERLRDMAKMATPDEHRMELYRMKNEALTAERDRLRDALRKYGRHVERCGVVGECVCGLDAALGKEG